MLPRNNKNKEKWKQNWKNWRLKRVQEIEDECKDYVRKTRQLTVGQFDCLKTIIERQFEETFISIDDEKAGYYNSNEKDTNISNTEAKKISIIVLGTQSMPTLIFSNQDCIETVGKKNDIIYLGDREYLNGLYLVFKDSNRDELSFMVPLTTASFGYVTSSNEIELSDSCTLLTAAKNNHITNVRRNLKTGRFEIEQTAMPAKQEIETNRKELESKIEFKNEMFENYDCWWWIRFDRVLAKTENKVKLVVYKSGTKKWKEREIK